MPVITVNKDYDATAYLDEFGVYSKLSGVAYDDVGYFPFKATWEKWRYGVRFPLTLLPAFAKVTAARYGCNVAGAGGAGHICYIRAYHSNGQRDPEPDGSDWFYLYCATGNFYAQTTGMRNTGQLWVSLGGTVCQDIEAAKAAGTKFSLGFWEELEDDFIALVLASSSQLEITYTIPIGGVTPIPAAKVLLGL